MMNMLDTKKAILCLLLFVFVLSGYSVAYLWTGEGDGVYWSDPLNWDPDSGPPGPETAYIYHQDLEGPGAIVTLNSTHETGRVEVGTGAGRGTLNIISGANLTVAPDFISDPASSGFFLGVGSELSEGTVNMQYGNITINAPLYVGQVGQGLWDMTGGTLELEDIHMGQFASGSSTFNINGGSVIARSIYVGRDNSDPMENSGSGTINVNAAYLDAENITLGESSLGSPDSSTVARGTMNIHDGTVSVSKFYLGYGIDGTKVEGNLNLSGTARLEIDKVLVSPGSYEAPYFNIGFGYQTVSNLSLEDDAVVLYDPTNEYGIAIPPLAFAQNESFLSLTIKDDAKILVPVSSLSFANIADCNMVMTGGEIFGGYHTYFGLGSSASAKANLNAVISGGAINIEGNLFIGHRFSTVNMLISGGTINAPSTTVVGMGNGSNALLTMESGFLNTGRVELAVMEGTHKPVGHIQMNGGTLNAGSLFIPSQNFANASIDLAGGEILISGDYREDIEIFVDAGVITAYRDNPAYERAVINIVYDAVNNTTHVSGSIPDNLNLAWGPTPGDGQRVVDPQEIRWRKGDDAVSHDVYFGENFDDVYNATTASTGIFKGTQPNVTNDNYYLLDELDLGQTYYWRIDERDSASYVWKGAVWSFTVADYITVDDFESYGSDSALKGVWGSNAALELDIAQDAQSMAVTGTNSVQMSIAGSDWTQRQLKAMDLSFHGVPTNSPAADQVYVAVTGTNGTATVYYDGDADDLVQGYEDDFNVWHIDLAELSAAGLSNVTLLEIGIGGDAGDIVYFDNIRLAIARCMPDRIADATGNCAVDFDDFAVLAGSWLTAEEVISAVNPGTSGLVLHYKFDETSGRNVTDSSGNGYTGYITEPFGFSNARWLVDGGKFGGCLEFDGRFGVDIPIAMINQIEDAITISVWAYSDTDLGIDYNGCIFHAGSASGGAERGWYAECPNVRGDVLFDTGSNPAQSPRWDRAVYTPDSAMQYAYKWNHWVFTKDASEGVQRIYNNGVLVAENTNAFAALDNVGIDRFAIGRWFDPMTSGYYKGKLDDFRVYSRALTQAEVVHLADLSEVTQPLDMPADFNQDGQVDVGDLEMMAEQWLEQELLWPLN